MSLPETDTVIQRHSWLFCWPTTWRARIHYWVNTLNVSLNTCPMIIINIHNKRSISAINGTLPLVPMVFGEVCCVYGILLFANWFQLEGVSVIEMHRAVITFLTTSQGSADCSSQDRALVSEDYGRFLDTGCTQTALDEPLSMIYGAGWFKRKETDRDYTVSRFQTFHYNYGIEVRPVHFSLALALSLASFFDGLSNLSDAFNLFGLPQPLLKAEAKLVTFTDVDGQLQANDAHLSADAPVQLVFLARTSEDALSWFKHERDEPFCVLLSSAGTGVTLVFCLQLSDGRSFWVSIRVPSTFLVRGSPDFAQDIEDIDPNESFRDQVNWPKSYYYVKSS